MKKRTAFIGAILSLLPLGQPLIIKTGIVLSSSAVILSLSEKVYAESVSFYIDSGIKKKKSKDYYGAISDFNKALEIDFKNLYALEQRAFSKIYIKDFSGAIIDSNKAIKLNPSHEDVQNGALFGTRGWAKYWAGDNTGACSDWRLSFSRGTQIANKWITQFCS